VCRLATSYKLRGIGKRGEHWPYTTSDLRDGEEF
jgi:hypothetical protein